MTQNGQNVSLGLRIAIVIGIGLLFPTVIYYGVATFEGRPERPRYEGVDLKTPEQRQKILKENQQKRDAYKQAQKRFANSLFWVAVPLGLVACLFGLIRQLGDVGTGFLIGGLIAVGEGHFGSWRYITDDLRFYSLVVGLIVLLFVGYRRLLVR